MCGQAFPNIAKRPIKNSPALIKPLPETAFRFSTETIATLHFGQASGDVDGAEGADAWATGYVRSLPQKRHLIACALMVSAQKGHRFSPASIKSSPSSVTPNAVRTSLA